MKTCVCGAMATERCIDCRETFCARHGSLFADDIVGTLLADVGGLLVHWTGPVSTYDAAFRCVPCLTRHAHRAYSTAALRGGAQLPPLPEDRFLRCCVIAAGHFALRDPSIERSVAVFAADVHRIASANSVKHNGSYEPQRTAGGRRSERPSWFLPYGSGPNGDYAIHVFADGTFVAEPWHGGELAEVPDAAFVSAAQLFYGRPPRARSG